MSKRALKIHLILLGGASYGALQNAFLLKSLQTVSILFCKFRNTVSIRNLVWGITKCSCILEVSLPFDKAS